MAWQESQWTETISRGVINKIQKQQQTDKPAQKEKQTSKNHQVRNQDFQAGNISNYYDNWLEITSDSNILDIVLHGLKLNFKTNDMQSKLPFEHNLSAKESEVISEEIQKLLNKKVISSTVVTEDDYFSSLFVRPKKDGVSFNLECDTRHFKIESIKQVTHMITQGCYMASLDIQHP